MKKYLISLTVLLIANFSLSAQDLTGYVDLTYGVAGVGNCVIGPQLPFASINPSPNTQLGGNNGYHPDNKIRGFSQLHVTGTGGAGKYGQFLISPQIGLNIAKDGHDSEKEEEVAELGYYRVRLSKYDILTEFTPTEKATIYSFTFPKSDSSYLAVDLGHNIPGDLAINNGCLRGGYTENGVVKIDVENNRITGGGTYWGGWSAEPFSVYFCMELSKPIQQYGTWIDDTLKNDNKEEIITQKKQRIGAFVGYQTEEDEQVYAKIAISFVSTEKAAEYLENEIQGWDFEKVLKTSKDKWNDKLNRIKVEGDESKKRIFYTSLYRSMNMPRDRSGDNPKWNTDKPYWDDHYCLWDTWKTAFPLNILINESMVRDNINAFIDRFEHNGQVLDAFIAGNDRVYQWDKEEEPYYFHNQGGDNVDNVIADAFVKEVEGVDWEAAYEILKFDAQSMRTKAYVIKDRGWVPFRTYEYAFDCSRTLEFSYNDFCIAQMAKGLGIQDDYKQYFNRSQQWENLWNTSLESETFKGFIGPKRTDGTWLEYDPMEDKIPNSPGEFDRSFYEGNSWVYSYVLPHGFPKLIDLEGGSENYIKRLLFALENEMIDFGNEPSFLTPFSFIYAGRPDLTTYWVRKNLANYTQDDFPGQEDSGAMSSWYIFASMGFFPIAGQDIYLISGPTFSKVTLTRENGKKIIIEAENLSEENIYVQSAIINGKILDRAWIKHKEIKNGAKIKFIMGATPSNWGRENLPPLGL